MAFVSSATNAIRLAASLPRESSIIVRQPDGREVEYERDDLFATPGVTVDGDVTEGDARIGWAFADRGRFAQSVAAGRAAIILSWRRHELSESAMFVGDPYEFADCLVRVANEIRRHAASFAVVSEDDEVEEPAF